MGERALILVNGEPGSSEFLARLAGDFKKIYCADGGADVCCKAGIVPSAIVGDMDSVDPEVLRHFEKAGVSLVRFPREKDQTDLELAVSLAITNGAEEIVFTSSLGGRLDHELANIFLLASTAERGVKCRVVEERCTIEFLHRKSGIVISCEENQTISLVPLSREVTGVTTRGLKWTLTESTLKFGSPLTVSNLAVSDTVSVEIVEGILAVIVPERTFG